MRISDPRRIAVVCAAGFLAACSAAGPRALPQLSSAASDAVPAAGRAATNAGVFAASKIGVTPAKASLLGVGADNALHVTVAEKGYAGTFTETSTCKGIATAAPASGKGPSLRVTITGEKPGSCSLTFADAKKHKAALPVTVTTAAIVISPTSISPGSKSVTIVLKSVNGKPPAKNVDAVATAALTKCTKGCTVAGPQSPPGTDAYALTVFDGANGKGNKLATGTASAKIVAGKANAVDAALAKIPVSLKFGTIPSGASGTAFSKPLPLTVRDADGNAIAGTYASAVTVSDNDASPIAQGSALQVGSAKASRSVRVTSSTDALKLVYGGLAIAPVTLSASAKGTSGATAQFTPSIGTVNYSGPMNGSTPEIDLYDPTPGDAGNSASFTVSQAGWSGSPFNNGFTLSFSGRANNCSSYTVSPPSNGSTFTVSVAASPAPSAGTCTLTASGATKESTVSVTLTYTTSTVGIEGKRLHRRPPQ